MSVGRRRGSDLELLYLWRRPVATALIRPLSWEPPYAYAIEKAKRQKKKKKSNYTQGIEKKFFKKSVKSINIAVSKWKQPKQRKYYKLNVYFIF